MYYLSCLHDHLDRRIKVHLLNIQICYTLNKTNALLILLSVGVTFIDVSYLVNEVFHELMLPHIDVILFGFFLLKTIF